MRRYLLLSILLAFSLNAENAPLLPFVDNVRQRFEPVGDTTWVIAGSSEFAARITATDMTPDGRYLAIGDADGQVSLFDTTMLRVLWTRPVIAGGEAVYTIKIDRAGAQILAAKAPGVNDFSHTYYIAGDGSVTDMGVQEAFSSQCQAVTKMDPAQFLFSPDGSTFYTLYETHARANRDACMVAAEKYVLMNNMQRSTVDVKLIALEPFTKPEEGEPDTVWCSAPERIALSADGKTLATSHCNGRVVLYSTAGGKLKLRKLSAGIGYMLRRAGYDPVIGAGYMVFNRSGEIFFGMGAPGQMAKSAIIRLSPDLAKAELMAYVHMPYPKPALSANENFLMAGSDIVFLWDLRKKQTLFFGPTGRNNGIHAQLHPTKRMVMLPAERQLLYLGESPGLKLRLTAEWKKTGRFVKAGDQIYLSGKGTFSYGYGEWLREDRKYANSWISEFKGDAAGDRGEAIELSFRSDDGAELTLFGGSGKKAGDGLRSFKNW